MAKVTGSSSACFGIGGDPCGERLHETLQEFAYTVVDELAVGGEQFISAADIGLRLRHRRHVEKHQRLTQMMVGAEPADRAGRSADDGAGLAAPHTRPLGPRAHIQCVFHRRRHRPIVLRRHEQYGSGRNESRDTRRLTPRSECAAKRGPNILPTDELVLTLSHLYGTVESSE